MRNHGDGQAGNTEKFSFRLAESKKLIGAYGDNGDMPFLQLDGIMDTP